MKRLAISSLVVALALALVAGSGCCVSIEARQRAASELRDAAERFAAAREKLAGARVPHPSYSPEEREKVKDAEADEASAADEIIRLADELSRSER